MRLLVVLMESEVIFRSMKQTLTGQHTLITTRVPHGCSTLHCEESLFLSNFFESFCFLDITSFNWKPISFWLKKKHTRNVVKNDFYSWIFWAFAKPRVASKTVLWGCNEIFCLFSVLIFFSSGHSVTFLRLHCSVLQLLSTDAQTQARRFLCLCFFTWSSVFSEKAHFSLLLKKSRCTNATLAIQNYHYNWK